MSRIRSIKPEFWTSEQVLECSPIARLMFIGMWNFADDCGRLPCSPKSIKAQIFPADDINLDTVRGLINELSANGLVLIYSIEDKDYLQITGWSHQRIDKPQPAKYPAPFFDHSENAPRILPPDRKGEDRKGKDTKGKDSEANASGAEAPRDVRSRLFTDGLSTLARLTGKGPDACRSFVGKCLKAASDDAVTVLGLIEDADRNRVVDPSAWISARLKPTGPPGISAKPLTASQRKQAETNDVRAQLRDLANGRESSRHADRILPVDHGERPEDLRGGTSSVVLALPRASGGRSD